MALFSSLLTASGLASGLVGAAPLMTATHKRAVGKPTPRLVAIEARQEAGRSYIELRGNLPKPITSVYQNPTRLVIDLPGTVTSVGTDRIRVGSPHVSRIRIGQHPDRTRVVLDAGSAADPFTGFRLALTLQGLKVGLGSGETSDLVTQAPGPATTRSQAPTPSTPVPQRPRVPGQATRLLAVNVREAGERLVIELRADGSVPYAAIRFYGEPERLMIDLPGVTNEVRRNRIEVESLRIARVRIGQHPDRTRVVLDAVGGVEAFEDLGVIHSQAGLIVAVGASGRSSELPAEMPQVSAGPPSSSVAPEDPAPFVPPSGVAPSASRGAATKLTSVRVQRAEGGLVIELQADGAMSDPAAFVHQDPVRLVLDLLGLTSQVESDRIEVRGSPRVARVRIGRHPDRTRVVIDAGKSPDPLAGLRLVRVPSGLLVCLGYGESLDRVVAQALGVSATATTGRTAVPPEPPAVTPSSEIGAQETQTHSDLPAL